MKSLSMKTTISMIIAKLMEKGRSNMRKYSLKRIRQSKLSRINSKSL